MSEPAEDLRRKAKAAYKAERYQDAAGFYEALHQLPENPDSAADRVGHALALMRSGQPDQAEAALRAAALLAPDDGAIHSKLGQLILRQGRTQAALNCFREAARVSPDADAYWQLFRIEHSLGNQAEAAAALDACLAMEPSHAGALEAASIRRGLSSGGPDALLDRSEAGDAAFADLVQFIHNRPGEDSPGPARQTSVSRRPVLAAFAAAAGFVLLYVWSRSNIF